MFACPISDDPALTVTDALKCNVEVDVFAIETVFPLFLPITTAEKLLLLLLFTISVFVLPVKVMRQYPIETAEPGENSQFPETSMLPFINPAIDEPEAQVIFTTTSFAVFNIVPPMLNEPFTVALPLAVSKALAVFVALMVRVEPELIVRLLHTAVAPDNRGWFAGTEEITTFSVASGT
jgi:hypothetical protein